MAVEFHPPGTSTAETRLILLGDLELWHTGKKVSLPATAQRLIAFLALHEWHQHRSVIAGTLWADVGEQRAAARLRTALWRLRRADPGLIRSDGPFLRIDPTIRIDYADLVESTRKLLADPFTPAEPAVTAAMLGCDLLPRWHEDWVVIERERLRQLRMHGLEALCRRRTAQGRHAAAIDAGLRAVQIEPLRETAQRVLIAAHIGNGNVAEAVRQFRCFRAALHRHLGIQPGPEIRDLLRDAIAAAQPAVSSR